LRTLAYRAQKREEKARRKHETASRIALATEVRWALIAEEQNISVADARRKRIQKVIVAEDLRRSGYLKKLKKVSQKYGNSFEPLPATCLMDEVEYARWASMQTTKKINAEEERMRKMLPPVTKKRWLRLRPDT
jgi:hypothetical protein